MRFQRCARAQPPGLSHRARHFLPSASDHALCRTARIVGLQICLSSVSELAVFARHLSQHRDQSGRTGNRIHRLSAHTSHAVHLAAARKHVQRRHLGYAVFSLCIRQQGREDHPDRYAQRHHIRLHLDHRLDLCHAHDDANFITRARLRYVAENDQTTGLRNRNAYEREQNDIPGRCRRTLSCVYMDINGLHELNNAMGHQAGDIMLREVAGRAEKAVR